MTEETKAIAPTPDVVLFSNVTAVRDLDGRLQVWVGQERMLGASQVSIGMMENGVGILSLHVPLSRVRLAEQEPKPAVIESRVENVIQGSFPKFRSVQQTTPVEPTPA